jgi:quinol monooxygenase YgiN
MRSRIGPSLAAATLLTVLATSSSLGKDTGGEAISQKAHVVLISRIHVKPGQEHQFEDTLRRFYDKMRRAEPGCLVNAMFRPSGAPGGGTGTQGESGPGFARAGIDAHTYVFYEVYRDATAARHHPTTPHFKWLMEHLRPLTEGQIELEFLQEVARK